MELTVCVNFLVMDKLFVTLLAYFLRKSWLISMTQHHLHRNGLDRIRRLDRRYRFPFIKCIIRLLAFSIFNFPLFALIFTKRIFGPRNLTRLDQLFRFVDWGILMRILSDSIVATHIDIEVITIHSFNIPSVKFMWNMRNYPCSEAIIALAFHTINFFFINRSRINSDWIFL